ncbi:MAG: hypothetical protein R3234_08130 [Thermoanaerobaculia bacterium]|nr:hypothetical protein [Thermoanaerobaculia bacterium]
MDPKRFKETYTKLELLEDRLSYKIRSRSVRSRSAPSIDNLDDRLKDVAEFTLELKDVVKELMQAIAAKPQE